MSTTDALGRPQRRLLAFGLLRAVGMTAALIALYYVAPLDLLTRVPLLAAMIVGMLLLAAMTAYQVWAILRAAQPTVRAIEALSTTVPFFLLLFAASYYLMSQDTPSSFSVPPLTRSDALYFTVTVFATVGFGDISPTTQTARLVVTAQMILNLVVLGLGVRVIVGAARRARQSKPADDN